MPRILTIILSLALASCIQVQVDRSAEIKNEAEIPKPIPSEERADEIVPIDIQALISGTGALAERLLPTGVIDIGRIDAPITLILFTEHHAKYARDFQLDLFPRLYSDFIEEGVLRFQIVILPLKKYPQSESAAAGLLCAAMQSRGMAMHQILSEKLDEERLEPILYAEDIELDLDEFSKCIESEEIKIILEQQKAWAASLDVSLVPTYFLNGKKYVGLPYYADLEGMIDELIK